MSTHDDHIALTVEKGNERISEIVMFAKECGITINSIDLRKPSLEDVFIKYTGKTIREEEGNWRDRLRVRHMLMTGGRR